MPATLVMLAPLTLESPLLGVAALAVLLATAITGIVRRPAMPRATVVLILLGAVALALAAGGISWRGPRAGTVAVVVDMSASTRGASYRDPKRLSERIAQLLGRRTTYSLYRMADAIAPAESVEQLRPAGSSARRTIFDPPPAAART
jgi:hypothetical protein